MFKYFYVVLLIFGSSSIHASPNQKLVDSFVKALSAANQPTTDENDIDHYLLFMDEGFTDFHAAYGVTITGKEKAKQNMLRKVTSRRFFEVGLTDLILGTDTAVMVLKENSQYIKDGQLKKFNGRTIWVLEFNDEAKISHIRRYLDW